MNNKCTVLFINYVLFLSHYTNIKYSKIDKFHIIIKMTITFSFSIIYKNELLIKFEKWFPGQLVTIT
jgi:hypothetical protein